MAIRGYANKLAECPECGFFGDDEGYTYCLVVELRKLSSTLMPMMMISKQ